jgi:hypothetical protein
MKVVHGTWIPKSDSNFIQSGCFYLWVETPVTKKRQSKNKLLHPGHLTKGDLEAFLVSELGIKESPGKLTERISPKYFALPTANNQPLPSPELTRYLEVDIPEDYEEFQYWQVDCYETLVETKTDNSSTPKAINVIKLLKEIHFIALYNSEEIQLGSDLLFWYYYTQSFREIILKDQYIPALKYRDLEEVAVQAKGKKKAQKNNSFEIYATWEIISEEYEANIKKYIEYMPLICVAGSEAPSNSIEFFEKRSLLRHFSENILHNIVTHTPSTAGFDKQISDSLLEYCLNPNRHNPLTTNAALEEYKKWLAWKNKITRTHSNSLFNLCFKLHSAHPDDMDNWQIDFLVASKQDPSLKIVLSDYWIMSQKTAAEVHKQFGKDFETNLLLNLGYAARMYPKLWQGLETEHPRALRLTLEEAFDFLKESAWVLEDAGFKITVPAWYTPSGRRRARIRLKASASKVSATESRTKSHLLTPYYLRYLSLPLRLLVTGKERLLSLLLILKL